VPSKITVEQLAAEELSKQHQTKCSLEADSQRKRVRSTLPFKWQTSKVSADTVSAKTLLTSVAERRLPTTLEPNKVTLALS
jgi:hypothetical protein